MILSAKSGEGTHLPTSTGEGFCQGHAQKRCLCQAYKGRLDWPFPKEPGAVGSTLTANPLCLSTQDMFKALRKQALASHLSGSFNPSSLSRYYLPAGQLIEGTGWGSLI